jgi:hypothetical protein
MRPSLISGLFVLVLGLLMTELAHAQPASFPTPTTRILAIGTIPAGTDLARVRAILPTEVRETIKLYLDGKIDQWFSLADRNGVVFLLNEADTRTAAAMLENLPLGQAHLMHFDLIPLAPLAPLRQLPGLADDTPPTLPSGP